jgi:hypothetical protein
MKINPYLYDDLFIRYDCLLALPDSIDLLDVYEMTNLISKFKTYDDLFTNENKFYMIMSERSADLDLSKFSITDYNSIKETVYLCNESKFKILKK